VNSAATTDTTAPTLNLPADITAEATSGAGAAVSYTVTATDNVDPNPTVSCTPASGSTFPLSTTTVNCTATDASGNQSSGSFTITVRDTTGPTLTLSSNLTAEATSSAGAAVTYSVSASDSVSTATVSCTPASGSTFPLGTTTVNCTARDAAGNESRGSFTITVRDTTGPRLNLSGNLTSEATSASGAVVNYSVSATDDVDANPTVSCTPASGSTFPLGSTTVNCTARDATGNTNSGSFTITVGDTTAPRLTVSGDLTAEAASAAGAVVNYSVSATDDIDANPTVSCTPASGSTFPLGATTVECTATDSDRNSSTGSFNVTVRDTTPPVLHLSGGVSKEATARLTPVTYTVSANDAVSAATVSCTDQNNNRVGLDGGNFPVGTTTITCVATDEVRNSISGSFAITIRDTTEPVVTPPASFSVEATSLQGAVASYSGASASDLVDGSIAPTCEPASGITLPLGAHQVTCTARDAAGNTGRATFTITVQDTTPPTLNIPGGFIGPDSVEATGANGAAVTYAVTASDAASVPTIACQDQNGNAVNPNGQTFPLGETTVRCIATDGAGRTNEGGFKVFVVNVQDTTPPTISGMPADMTVEATSAAGAAATWTAPTANDLVDGDVAVTCDPASGSTFGLGETTVTCEASDGRKNKATRTFKVTVRDTIAPTLDDRSNVTARAVNAQGAIVTYTLPTATDAADPNPTVTCDKASGSQFPLGETEVSCTAKDASNNTSPTKTFKVIVSDQDVPVVTVPANIVAEATSAAGAVVNYSGVSANDNVDGAITPSCAPASGGTFALGATQVNCEATDAAGNTGRNSFSVTVRDTTAPTNIQFTGITAGQSFAWGSVPAASSFGCTAEDTVGLNSCTISGYSNAVGRHTLTATAEDNAGNKSTATLNYQVTGWTLKGFHAPIGESNSIIRAAGAQVPTADANTIWNTAKGGSTIPLKFNIFAGSVERTSTGTDTIKSFNATRITCPSGTPITDAVEELSTAGTTSLRYDSTAGQYIQNWKTSTVSSDTCFRVALTAADDSVIYTFVRLRK
jgi:hypothetical protein